MKLCIGCKHFDSRHWRGQCLHGFEIEIDPVSGYENTYAAPDCESERSKYTLRNLLGKSCGPDGKFWEAK